MNKKILVILAASALIVSTIGASVGCAKKRAVLIETTPAVRTEEHDIEQLSDSREVTPVITPADFQNPVMNFTGSYFNNKTTLFIEADGSENAKLTIVLSADADTKTVLTADAKFNGLTNSIAYGNGTKKEIKLAKDGSTVSEKTIYMNGTGVIVFDSSKATWNDETEKIENMIFTPGTPDEFITAVQVANQTTKTKKTAKKTAKKTSKKTAKKAKKTAKKTTKLTAGNTKFTYGKSTFAAKTIVINVNIRKDNTASVTIERKPVDTDYHYKYDVSDYWMLSGRIDPETGIISYSNCSRMYFVKSLTFNQSRNEYLHGKGEIKISGNTLTWNDRTEHYADGMHFSKV